jgi:HSP20 family molecular chaperone IbpA
MVDHVASKNPGGERGAEFTRNVPVYIPRTDIYESGEALILSLELPGVDVEGLSVTIEKQELKIIARGAAQVPHGCSLLVGEYRPGDFERSFTLSEAIDSDRIEAALRDGVLRLTLPKAMPAPAKAVPVSVA